MTNHSPESDDNDQQHSTWTTETSSSCPQTPIGKQAAEIIDEDTDWEELSEVLPVDRYRHSDPYLDRESTPFEPMFLAYLWARVEEHALSAIPRELDAELAQAFGFNPENMPDESTFRRLRLNRFTDMEGRIARAAKEIKIIAAEQGAPIGVTLTSSKNNDGKPSKRTINRMLRRKQTEVLDEIKDVAIPSMDLPRPEEAVYEDDELLILAAIASIKQMAANGAGERLGDLANPDPDKDDPFYEDGPSGQTLLNTIKKMNVDQIVEVVNYALKKTYTRAKPKLEDIDTFDSRVMLALDITYVAYYGETEGLEWVMGAPDYKEKDYEWCHRFATASIVGDHTHYTVAILPIGSVEHTDNSAYAKGQEQSYYIGDVARRLLSKARECVDIRMVYADREFYATDVIHTLEQKGLYYVIPALKDERIGHMCERFDRLKRGYADDEEDEVLYVKNDYAMYGPVKHETTNTKVETNLVILPPDDDGNRTEKPQPFITNSEVSDTIALDRRETVKKIKRYNNRAAIETSYTKIKECAAWTTSREFEVRLFHFGFACIVYNMWLLVDFLVQHRIGVIETRRKPRITLSRFLDELRDALRTLV